MSQPGPQLEHGARLLAALRFAAEMHTGQQRKDKRTPYINHPISVAEMLAGTGRVTDLAALQAAFLHDTLEDTRTTPQELDEHFGPAVRSLVEEVSDDKGLAQQERRRLQVERAAHLSLHAKEIRIADKICNLLDISPSQPPDWPPRRKRDYLDWAETVVAGCRGCNPYLERAFDAALRAKRDELRVLGR
jgi:(p)ppGpp synthase/HD superfamily hydrolase